MAGVEPGAPGRRRRDSSKGDREGHDSGHDGQAFRLGARDAWLVFAAVLAFRFAYLGHAALDPSFFTPWLDARGYLQWATDIAAGKLVASEPFFHAPLYPYFLALLLLAGHGSLIFVRAAQAFLGAATAVLAGALGARLFGRTTGLISGLLTAATACLVAFDLELLGEVVFVPLAIGALLAVERAMRRPSPGWMLATGVILGLAAVARPNVLLFVPVALALVAWAMRTHGEKPARILGGTALIVLGTLLPIAPATLHNLLAGDGAVVISSQAGVNFYIGNGPTADGYSATMVGPVDTPPYDKDGRFTDNIMSSARFVANHDTGRTLKPSEVSRYWFRRTWRSIAAAPGAWAALMLRKAFYLTGGFEIGDNKNLSYLLDDWLPFRFMPRWWWLFPLAAAGFTVPGARQERALLGGFALALGASVVAFLVVERFRLALYPVLCIMAAHLLVWMAAALGSRRWSALLPRLAMAVVLLAWTRWEPTGYTVRQRIDARVARGAASEARGDPAEAEHLYLGALEVDPSSSAARQAYGSFLVRHGRLGEARAYLANGPPPPTPAPVGR